MRRVTCASLFVLFLAGCGPGIPSASERAEYEAKAQPIIDAIEAYFRTHGEYPATLEEIGLQHFETPWGLTRYTQSDAGSHGGLFTLGIGDGFRHKYEWFYMGIGRHPNASNARWTFIDNTAK